jgi:prevent-host-death family protein
MQIGTYEAKNQLSALVERAERGEVIQITRHGKAVAELRPVTGARRRSPVFGGEPGLVEYIADDFTAPLDDFADYTPPAS